MPLPRALKPTLPILALIAASSASATPVTHAEFRPDHVTIPVRLAEAMQSHERDAGHGNGGGHGDHGRDHDGDRDDLGKLGRGHGGDCDHPPATPD